MHIFALSAPTRVTPPPPSPSSPSSYVTRRSFHISLPPPVNSPPFGFVYQRNRTCPSAHVRTSGCVSRVSTFDGRGETCGGRRRRRPRGERGRRESRVRKIYYDLLADPGRSVCHPCPPPCRPPATAPFPPRSPSSLRFSSLILLLFLLYYDGLLHFHSDAGLKIKSLIHDA